MSCWLQDWVTTPGNNFGFLVKSDDEATNGTARILGSREALFDDPFVLTVVTDGTTLPPTTLAPTTTVVPTTAEPNGTNAPTTGGNVQGPVSVLVAIAAVAAGLLAILA